MDFDLESCPESDYENDSLDDHHDYEKGSLHDHHSHCCDYSSTFGLKSDCEVHLRCL